MVISCLRARIHHNIEAAKFYRLWHIIIKYGSNTSEPMRAPAYGPIIQVFYHLTTIELSIFTTKPSNTFFKRRVQGRLALKLTLNSELKIRGRYALF